MTSRIVHRLFYTFVFIHVFLWTIAPILVRHSLPMDALEGALWGHQLEWGYDKNPFLNGWLTRLAIELGGHSGWMIYLFSQLSVALCFWAIFELGKKFLTPFHALIGVVILEGLQYYNFHAIDFNDNTLELSLWSLTSLFFYEAIKKTPSKWVGVAIFAGLAMMAKYYTGLLLLPMAIFLMITKQGRAQFKSYYFYLSCIIFAAITIPHFVWLYHHDFVTLKYALGRVSSPPTLFSHFYFPTQFLWQQLEVFLPSLFLFILAFYPLRQRLTNIWIKLPKFDRNYVLWIGMGPLALTVLLSMITGIKLRAGWGQPLLSFSGLLLVARFAPPLTRYALYRFIIIIFVFMMLSVSVYAYSLIQGKKPSSAIYPSKIMAHTLTEEWHRTFHTPLKFLVGTRWVASVIAFYSKDHPSVYIDANPILSPWIKEAELNKTGGIFVWNSEKNSSGFTYQSVKEQYPKLLPQRILHFTWLNNRKLEPVTIYVALLPPKGISSL